MKSPMVQALDYITDKENYSELTVMKSAAGWYVGTYYHDTELDFVDNGTRDSGYFQTEEEAERFLKMVESAPNPQEYLRMHP